MPSSALGVYKPLVQANYLVFTDHSVSDCTAVQDVCSYCILGIWRHWGPEQFSHRLLQTLTNHHNVSKPKGATTKAILTPSVEGKIFTDGERNGHGQHMYMCKEDGVMHCACAVGVVRRVGSSWYVGAVQCSDGRRVSSSCSAMRNRKGISGAATGWLWSEEVSRRRVLPDERSGASASEPGPQSIAEDPLQARVEVHHHYRWPLYVQPHTLPMRPQ